MARWGNMNGMNLSKIIARNIISVFKKFKQKGAERNRYRSDQYSIKGKMRAKSR